MIRGNLNDDFKQSMDEELTRFELMEDYLRKNGKENDTFTSLRQAESIKLANDAVKINNILLMQHTNGKTDLLNRTSEEYSKEEIEKISQSTGLKKQDIILLLQDGMKLVEIAEKANKVPFKENAESAAIRELIRKDINIDQLDVVAKRGVQVIPKEDGSIQVTNLQKVAEIDENGLLKLEPRLLESLKPFEELGLIQLSNELVVKEIEPESEKRINGNALKVVSLQEKKDEMAKEEKEKQEIAKGLNINSDEIVSVIRIEDKENGSKLLNDSNIKDGRPIYIVRTRNGITGNKFITARETEDGKYEQMQGFESTPVAKEVASLLKDTQNSMNSVSLEAGEIRAGKMHSMQNNYDYFLIRRAGESIDDDSNYLLFVGTSGDTDMSLIESRENGERRFVQVPVSSIHPRSIYLENNMGYSQETSLSENSSSTIPQPEIRYEDINLKKELLERLKQIEAAISQKENESENNNADQHTEENLEEEPEEDFKGVEPSDDDSTKNIDELYSERSKIIDELGYNESTAVKEIEDDLARIPGSRRP